MTVLSPVDNGFGGAGTIAAWNLASRLTGFVRVLAVGAALGTTYAGNTYQSANLVSNILFELLAAGVLSSVLVPTFVARFERGGREEASALAGGILGVLLAASSVRVRVFHTDPDAVEILRDDGAVVK